MKFCGKIDRNDPSYSSTHLPPESEDSLHNMDNLYMQTYDTYAEYDPGKRMSGIEFETEIFISKQKVPNGESLDLSIIYTPFKSTLNIRLIYIYCSNIKF